MNSILEYRNSEFNVRTVSIDGEPWFVAKDVCEILGLKGNKGSDNLRSLHEDERASIKVDTLGGAQDMVAVNESGLYALIFKSRKPEAQAFRRWVTGEVLPALRRDGFYKMLELDRVRVSEIRTELEEAKKRVKKKEAHLMQVESIPGCVSINQFLAAVGLELPPKTRSHIGTVLENKGRWGHIPRGYTWERPNYLTRCHAGRRRRCTFLPSDIAEACGTVLGIPIEIKEGEAAMRSITAQVVSDPAAQEWFAACSRGENPSREDLLAIEDRLTTKIKQQILPI